MTQTNLHESYISLQSVDNYGRLHEVEVTTPQGVGSHGHLIEASIEMAQQGVFVGPHEVTVDPLKTFKLTATSIPSLPVTSWSWSASIPQATLTADDNVVTIRPPASFNGTSFTVTATTNDGRTATVTFNVLPHTLWTLQGPSWVPLEHVEHWAHQPVIFLAGSASDPHVYIDPNESSAVVEADGTLTIESSDPGLSVDTATPGVVSFSQDVG